MVARRLRARGLALALWALPLVLSLAACQRNPDAGNVDSLDAELADRNNAANARDPAMVSALQDEIMVDPQLAQSANHDAVRPPAKPYAAPVPTDATTARPPAPVDTASLRHAPAADAKAGCPDCGAAKSAVTLGALAQRQRNRSTAACGGRIGYSAAWANRLPADVPLYPDARVIEAAGNSEGGCNLRVVSFSSPAAPATMIDWYYTRLSQAGFSAEHQTDGNRDVLGGTRDRDGGAYVIYVTRRDDGGSDVDLVTNNGN
ncbi:hypothetical protein ACLB0R_03175 [Sphingomonas sp. GlSt437]|uniref:hypothetical protein n=1 Tax=Sphingomonas sp. GlSt437 TaxID=3389970 RepID=UPI003A881709